MLQTSPSSSNNGAVQAEKTGRILQDRIWNDIPKGGRREGYFSTGQFVGTINEQY